MLLKYAPALLQRAIGVRNFTYRTPVGEADITLQLKPGDNEVDDKIAERFLGNSAFLGAVLKGGISGGNLKKTAIAKTAEWAAKDLVDKSLAELAKKAGEPAVSEPPKQPPAPAK